MNTPFIHIGEPRIVYDRDGIIVVAKPSGMHCAPGGERGSLCSWLFSERPELAGVAGHAAEEGGLLHRLDCATSGLVAFAASDATFEAMARSASAGRFRKSYRALGLPGMGGLLGSRPSSTAPGTVDIRLWEAALRSGACGRLAAMLSDTRLSSRFRPYGPGASMVACAIPDGTLAGRSGGKAWTKAVYSSGFGPARSHEDGVLVEILLTRGFRHQIRAQMAWIGLALKGDSVYGDSDEGETLHLQASRLEFDPPGGDPPGGDPPGGDPPGGYTPIIINLDACQ